MRLRISGALISFATLLIPPGLVRGASPPPTPTAAPKPCTAPEYRQFDFWIGDWEVRMRGKVAGTNRIEKIVDGCGLRETWHGTGGSVGTSLNTWNPTTRRWHQTWLDNGGMLLQIDGDFRGGKMILEGETVSSAGARTRERISWTPLPDGTVRQLWEQSDDAGKTWKTAFDGIYARR
jgi:hypothetical protein